MLGKISLPNKLALAFCCGCCAPWFAVLAKREPAGWKGFVEELPNKLLPAWPGCDVVLLFALLALLFPNSDVPEGCDVPPNSPPPEGAEVVVLFPNKPPPDGADVVVVEPNREPPPPPPLDAGCEVCGWPNRLPPPDEPPNKPPPPPALGFGVVLPKSDILDLSGTKSLLYPRKKSQ